MSQANPPIKRHPAMQPFSRDHYGGLVAAQAMLRAADGTPEERLRAATAFHQAWQREICAHFDDEERLLLPLISDAAERDRLLDEHQQLRGNAAEAAACVAAGTAPDSGWLRTTGQRLNDHIRWEERQLFSTIEAAISEDELKQLASDTTAFEATRPRSTCERK